MQIVILLDLPGWAHESLWAVGIADHCSQMDEPVRVDWILVPSFGDPTRLECEWLRDRVTASKETHRRVFIARMDATRRRVGNMDELQRVFDRWDIEVVVLSKLSVREQIRLFSEAELVIGVHGAGFANVIYTYDAHVIELFGTRRLNTYARLCEIVGVAYEHLTCAQHGIRVQVDTTELEQRLDAWAAR